MESRPAVEKKFLEVLKKHTAGDPQNAQIIWTDLSCTEIKRKLEKFGENVGRKLVKKLLKKHGYKKRKIKKSLKIGASEDRNEQFEKISELKKQYEKDPNPIISVDTKKKEPLGKLHRAGQAYSKEAIKAFDHDFSYLAEGVAIPHGIYDIKKNSACINIGTSHDTAEFACDSLRKWWNKQGQHDYPDATSILMLVDSGGSNSCRHYVFKEQLQKLADEIGIEIRVAHYPPYCSKWNPIEHRLFPHITRSMQGISLASHKMVKQLIKKTTTTTGLQVVANIMRKAYKTGKKVAKDFKDTMKIEFDDHLGKWNYCAAPIPVA